MIGLFFGLIYLAIVVLILAGVWKTFVKAGRQGWEGIIPIYNVIIVLQMVNKPLWWIVLFFIPLVNLVVAILVAIEFAKLFGKGVGFAIGLLFLGFIFFPILGFGDAKYTGPQVQGFPVDLTK